MPTLDLIRHFITQTFYVPDDIHLTDDTSLIDSGVVDSTGMLDVILFIEDEFAIQVTDRETTPQNLESITRIAAFVDRKTAAATG
jgi:acyl carrier protein